MLTPPESAGAPLPGVAASPEEGLVRLRALMRGCERVVVAYSGGVDSSLVLQVAFAELRQDCLAVTARSPTMANAEYEAAIKVAADIGAPHETITLNELENADFVANLPDRCFHCKDGLYRRLTALAAERGYHAVLDGTNLDDLAGHRPGYRAIQLHGVRAPLVEAGLTKSAIRILSRQLGLPTADKPSSPCLSSRVPFGTPIDVGVLRMIEDAETGLRGLGFGELRVRHHGSVARIEIPPESFARLLELRCEAVAAVRAAGYQFVALDLVGLRSGSLSEGLGPPTRRG
ncbi:MAG: ATP-dependent sacrificial sulfur transferase LarE [Candidatus Schekmanbacteria bacterium]|nr:ATP-dependent sacrificial sulfur transferase LarE [Candidatus Schekmanbacteria bacterium]